MGSRLSEDDIRMRIEEKNKLYIREIDPDERGQRRFEYRCSCGAIRTVNIRGVKGLGFGCHACVRRNNVDEVKEDFKALGLIPYLDDNKYKNSKSPIQCTCNTCGETRTTTYGSIRLGCRPCKCSYILRGEKMRGDKNHQYGKRRVFGGNHPMGAKRGHLNHNWNPNLTNEDRLRVRHYPAYYVWRDEVYRRDNYTCQICGKKSNGDLNAHHIYSHEDFPSLRLELSNGLTTCFACHSNNSETGFHRLYGTRHATPEMLIEYVKLRREQLNIEDMNDIEEVVRRVKTEGMEFEPKAKAYG